MRTRVGPLRIRLGVMEHRLTESPLIGLNCTTRESGYVGTNTDPTGFGQRFSIPILVPFPTNEKVLGKYLASWGILTDSFIALIDWPACVFNICPKSQTMICTDEAWSTKIYLDYTHSPRGSILKADASRDFIPSSLVLFLLANH